jgi:hypothetical protein
MTDAEKERDNLEQRDYESAALPLSYLGAALILPAFY